MEDFEASDNANGNNSSRVTTKQRAYMLAFMKTHPSLATGRAGGPYDAQQKVSLLNQMAAELNLMGRVKSYDKWYKCWQDWRSDVKKKSKRIAHYSKHGSYRLKLTPLEAELVNFIGIELEEGIQLPVYDAQEMLYDASTSGDFVDNEMPEETWMDTPPEDIGDVKPPVEALLSYPMESSTPTREQKSSQHSFLDVTHPLRSDGLSHESNASNSVSESEPRRFKQRCPIRKDIFTSSSAAENDNSKHLTHHQRHYNLQEVDLSSDNEVSEELLLKRRKLNTMEKIAAAQESVAAASLRNAKAMEAIAAASERSAAATESLASALTAATKVLEEFMKRKE